MKSVSVEGPDLVLLCFLQKTYMYVGYYSYYSVWSLLCREKGDEPLEGG